MAIGSGLASSFSVSAETASYGTRVAPARSFRAKSASINRTQERVQGAGIQAGAFGATLAHFVETVQGADATVALDVPMAKFGIMLQALMGTVVTPVAVTGSTGAYIQTHTLADNVGQSLTGQVGAPYRSGTIGVQEGTGLVVTGVEFSCAVKEILSANVKMNGKKFDSTQTLATPSYSTAELFHGGQMALKLGMFSSEAAVTDMVRSVSMSFERPQDTDDYTAGNSGLKSVPVLNDLTKISGSVLTDWTTASKVAFSDRVQANTSCSLVWEFVGSVAITATTYPTIRFTLPSVVWSGDMQGADGVDALKSTWNFEWKYDGTNLPKIEYQSVDVAI